MTDSASLKIARAAKHIADLDELLRRARPFPFVLKTDTQVGQRTLGCEKNQPVVDHVAILSGDAIHNLRAALDHAYWEIVSPRCSARELGSVQFPFSKKANSIDQAIRQRLAHYAGTGFYFAIRKLQPHDYVRGNVLLFLIHEFDVTDKHKLLLPAVEQTTHTFAWIETIDPGFPWKGGGASTVTFSEEATYTWPNNAVPPDQLGVQVAPHIFKRVLDVHVDVVFPFTLPPNIIVQLPPVVPMLDRMREVVCETIAIMREAAASC